ncbi:MAG: autotransporter-associated beta strand repeat-containing protein [Verrucomicrobiaceae bacterium]|nr:autotransporter-associated beta strand repeat-containing protein [Verrucomicrobiaceae bacterium]
MLAAWAALSTSGLAATGTWTGPGTTWDTSATNWSGVSGTPWDSTNGATNNAITGSDLTVSGTVFTNGITFSATKAISGGTITLAGSNPFIDVTTSGQTGTISSVLAGTSGFTKTGAGNLTLTGSNTFTGALTANAGTVSFSSLNSAVSLVLAGGNFTANGNTTVASLAANSAGGITVNTSYLTVGSLTGSSALTVTQGTGTQYTSGLKLTGTSNSGFSGTITAGASLYLANEDLLGTNANALTLGSALYNNSGVTTLTVANHRITLTSGGHSLNGNMNLTGGLTGTGGIRVRSASAGAIVIGGTTNDYAGNTEVYTDSGNNSTLRLGAGNVLPSGTGKGNLQLTTWSTGYAILDLNGFNQTVNGLNNSNSAGTRAIIDNVTAGGNVTLTVGAANATGNTFAGVIKNTTGTVNLTKIGTGTQTLTGANTHTGGTTVNQGTLTVGTGGTLGATTGALTVSNTNSTAAGTASVLNLATAVDTTVGSLSGTIATPTSGTNTATINTQTGRNFTVNQTAAGTYAGVIAGAGSVTLGSLSTNTLTLTGTNTYTGTTTVTAGSLQVGSSGTGTTGTGAVTVQTGGTIFGTGTVKGSTFTAQSGSTVQAGDGTAQANYGTLNFTPASGSGTFDFQSGSSTILGLNPGGTGDLLNFNGLSAGTLNFNGGLTVTAPGYTPIGVDVFNLLDWTNISTTTFASRFSAGSYSGYLLGNGDDNLGFNLPDISSSGYAWDISQFTTNGTISTVFVAPEPSRALLLMLGLMGLIARRRRR